MKLDYKLMAEEILKEVGGKDNIRNMTHCATRLRLNLKDTSIVDNEKVEQIQGVANVVDKAGQYQILIGTEVPKLYEEFEKLVGSESDVAKQEKDDSEDSGSVISNIFSAISGIFSPLLAPLAGSGVLKGLLILFVQLGWISETGGGYQILNAASNAVFYFLPILLAITSARRFGANPYISALIGASLIHPDFMALMGDVGNGARAEFFGIPVVLMNYTSTVVPIILSIWVYSYLYKWLDRHIHETLKLVLIPLLSLAIMVPLTSIMIGPLGVYGGELIGSAVDWLIERSGVLTGILIGGGWSVLVSLGIHWAVNPIMINNISTQGFDYIVPFTFACNFATIGTALGVYLKARDKKIKSFSMTGVVTISLSAIIEPTLFGLLVKNRKLFVSQIIGGAIGGAYLGLMKVVTSAFVFGSVTTLPAFANGVTSNLVHAVIGLLISLVVSAVIAYFVTDRDEQLA